MTLQTIDSEVVYDLIQDHLDVLLTLLEGPKSRETTVQLLGDEATLGRFIKHGLLKCNDDGTVLATSEGIRQSRQEGMMSFLERYIVPALASGLDPQATEDINLIAKAWNRQLRLPINVIEGFREHEVQPLLEELLEISNQPSSGEAARMSLMVIASTEGASDVQNEDIDLLQLAKSASLQRSKAGVRDRAILTQLDAIMDPQRLEKSIETIDSWLSRVDKKFGESQKEAEQEPYCIALAVHWRRPQTVAENAVEMVEPC
ncbi:MAG: hypothetical protein VX210_01040 [Myxococcota bacterium]|nr:hypothetical protein [Myxococcota bacterium]